MQFAYDRAQRIAMEEARLVRMTHLRIVIAVAMAPAVPALASALHSFAAEFDITRPIQLTGTVKRMEFSNPHSWLYLEVMVEGVVQEWAMPAGTEVSVQGYQARDRSFRAAGREVTLPDGSSLSVGSTDAGAPSAE
jgi:hypothetical protein